MMNKGRESIKDLIEAGVVIPGTEIEMIKSRGEIVFARILADGQIELKSGECFRTPSGAARFVRQGMSTNGWRTWRLSADFRQLGDLRSENS
jgi:tmRNA-binding protein